MNRDAMKQLRMDRRLLRRRGWMSDAELAVEVGKLPDVSHKMITLGEAADQMEAAKESGEAAASAEAGRPKPE